MDISKLKKFITAIRRRYTRLLESQMAYSADVQLLSYEEISTSPETSVIPAIEKLFCVRLSTLQTDLNKQNKRAPREIISNWAEVEASFDPADLKLKLTLG